MPVGAAQPSGFEQLLQKFLTYAYPIVGILFWIALVIVLFLAWRDFRRLVDHYAPRTGAAGQAGEEKIDIEDFVD